MPWAEAKDYHVFLKAVRKLSGIETFGAHRCRHTFAFRWIWNGRSLSALQAVLGHSSVAMTEIYARTTDALVRREAERLWAAEDEAVARLEKGGTDTTLPGCGGIARQHPGM